MKYEILFCCFIIISPLFACSGEKWCLDEYGYEDCDEVREALDNAVDSFEINDLQWIKQEYRE
jgi:hypothetical protein